MFSLIRGLMPGSRTSEREPTFIDRALVVAYVAVAVLAATNVLSVTPSSDYRPAELERPADVGTFFAP